MNVLLRERNHRQREIEEDLVPVVAAIESIKFIDSKDRQENIYVAAIDPPRIPRLINLQRLKDNLKGKDPDIRQWEKIQEAYENNQNIYMQRFEIKRLTETQLKSQLTQLELWLIRFLEPPPILTSRNRQTFKQELDDWLDRVLFRKENFRDPECPEEVSIYLCKTLKKSDTSKLISNYLKAEKIYRELESTL